MIYYGDPASADIIFLGFTGESQGAQNYLPPPPESKIELWVPKSTVDTQILKTHTGKSYLP